MLSRLYRRIPYSCLAYAFALLTAVCTRGRLGSVRPETFVPSLSFFNASGFISKRSALSLFMMPTEINPYIAFVKPPPAVFFKKLSPVMTAALRFFASGQFLSFLRFLLPLSLAIINTPSILYRKFLNFVRLGNIPYYFKEKIIWRGYLEQNYNYI